MSAMNSAQSQRNPELVKSTAQYQFEGVPPEHIDVALKGRLPPDLIQQVKELSGQAGIAVLEWLKLGDHISEPYILARDQANRLPDRAVIVIFDKNSYFQVDAAGRVSGPSARLCKIDAESAPSWAKAALANSDSELFARANIHLPARP